MIFYKVVAIDKEGILAKDELFTQKEVNAWTIPKECLKEIELPKALTFRKYGRRFEYVTNTKVINRG